MTMRVVVSAALTLAAASGFRSTANRHASDVRVEILRKEATDLIARDAAWSVVGKEQFVFTEGPVWVPDSKMWIFSDVPADTMYQYVPDKGVSVFAKPSRKANGNFLDSDGTLLTCQHVSRSVVRFNVTTKKSTTVVSSYEGNKLTSPNDVVASKKGAIYFTDPDYGTSPGFGHGKAKEQANNNVFRLDPGASEPVSVVSNLVRPNGLVFNADESKMYISDSGASFNGYNPALPHDITVYDVAADGSLHNGQLFATVADGLGVPDGMKVDRKGNLWSTSEEGVEIYSPSGVMLAKIHTPEGTANLAFGGADGKDLLLTAGSSVWIVRVKVREA